MTLVVTGLPASNETKFVTTLLWTGALCGTVGLTIIMIPGSTRWWLIRQLPRLPVVGKTFGELINGVVLYQARPRVIVCGVVIGLVSHAALITGFYCAGRSIEPWVLDLPKHFYFMPMAELFATMLPTPGGIGGLEGAVQYSYQSLAQGEVSSEQAQNAGFIAALMFRLIQVGIASIGMLYYFASRQEITSALVDAQSETERGLAVSAVGTVAPR